jgi:Transglycosylase SLT domain
MLRGLVIILLLIALAPAFERAEIPRKIADIIRAEADRVGLDPALLLVIAELESGGDPRAVTGSYAGMFQLGRAEFGRYGGGDIFDPSDNARAAADMIADQVAAFAADYGRESTWTEIYLSHQQGVAGLDAHLARPEGVAWRNVRGAHHSHQTPRSGSGRTAGDRATSRTIQVLRS